jgi:hypothetical protein
MRASTAPSYNHPSDPDRNFSIENTQFVETFLVHNRFQADTSTIGWSKIIKVGNSILHKAALFPYAISDLFAKFEQNSIIFTGAKFLQDFN